jgi:hypothetical protein
MRNSLAALAAAVAVVLAMPAAAAGQGMYEAGRPPGPGAKSWLAERATLPPYDPPRMSDGETGERLYLDPQTFCMKSVPRYSQRGFDLAQTSDHVAMMLNWGHVHRSIPIDAASAHPSPNVKFWMGNPRGHWEGDTLVVEVSNINGKMWLDSVGNFYSENARVVERFRLASANKMDYEVRIEDPTVFTEPVTLSYDLQRAGTGGGRRGGGGGTPDRYAVESWEHACHEGNTHHVQEAHVLGFKWYKGGVRPE